MSTPAVDPRAAGEAFGAHRPRSPLGRPGRGGPGRFGPGYDLPGRRSGVRLLPFPRWSTRTRRGTDVSVGGCCLPIPIGCLTGTVLVGAAAVVVGRAARG
ncbi:hypothetical protein QYM41_15930 [Kocuria sp. CPCC 205268]|uniref:hypothetical protein n=1 Tax=Kocuria oxytropis TaxID=3058913 RepID=UPI0034D452C9